MKTIRIILILILMLISFLGCEPDVVPITLLPDGSGEEDRARVSLVFEDSSTKSSLLEGCEEVKSGALAVVFYTDNGLLDSVQELGAESISVPGSPSSTSAQLSLPVGRAVQIYVIGNLWAVNKSTGEKTAISRALAESFPSTSLALEDWMYRIDGSDINSQYRFQKLSEVATWGIPFTGHLASAQYYDGQTVSISCKRLFAKLRLTVDHSGLDGGVNTDYFRNVKLHLRQANCRMQPFSKSAQKALSTSDIIEGDYDPSMKNASVMSFDFYIPENMQGELLPGNTDQEQKNYEAVLASHGAEQAKLLTYVEFTGEVNSEAGGYGGPVTYRFYLGSNNCSNFDIERGREYDVELGFKVGSLFNPSWKIESSLSDSREIGISADASHSRILTEGQMVAVRKNRPGKFYVYVKAGQGNVLRTPDGLSDPNSSPQSLADCYLSSDFLTLSNNISDTPKKAQLDDMGISASYDEATGLMSFVVSDQSKFSPGEELTLTLKTVPEGKSISFKIKSYDNLSVEWDKALNDYFLPGMSRTAQIEGFSSELNIKSSTVHCYKHKPSEGGEDIIQDSYTSNPSLSNGSFKIYNVYYCNATSCTSGKFYIRPSDDFNDGNNDGNLDDNDALVYDIKNYRPDVQFRSIDGQTRVSLDMAGNEEELYAEVRYKIGESNFKSFYYSDFDSDIFDLVYKPHFVRAGHESELIDAEGNTLFSGSEDSYIGLKQTKRTTSSGWPIYEAYRNRIGDEYYSRTMVVYKDYSILFMQTPSDLGKFSGRNIAELEISLLPFISVTFGLGFEDKYDDYTLWNGDYLDSEYSFLTKRSVSAQSGRDINFHLKSSSGLSLFAKPISATEGAYTVDGGISPSISITQENPGENLKLRFIEDGTNKHTAGPHQVFARVTNKHSGEYRDELLDEFDVYVHLIVGLRTDIISGGPDSNAGMVYAHPEIISDLERTSYGGQYASNPIEVFVSTADYPKYLLPDTSTEAIIFKYDPSIVGNYNQSVIAHPSSYGSFETLIEYNAESQKDAAGNYYSEALEFMLECEFNDKHYQFCKLAADKSILDIKFNNYSSSGMTKYDETAFGDLETSSGKGFYVFHRLGDLRKDSNNWIALFEHYAGL